MRYPCAQKACPNHYDTLVGGEGWGGTQRGGDCMPCYYAGLIRRFGKTPEEIAQNQPFMAEMLPHLEKGGWTWRQVEDSFALGVLPR